MITIRLGGFGFNVPQRWEDVTFDKALKLYDMKTFNITDIVTTLIDAPGKDHLKYSHGVILTVFEILSFVTETPSVVTDKVKVPPAGEWKYKQYELCRQAITKHSKNIPFAFARITQILELPEKHYVEVGAKAVDAMMTYIKGWGDFMEATETTEKEIAAGIDRLKVFGAYPILESYAQKYGQLPSVAENEEAHTVIYDWISTQEKSKYVNNYQEKQRAS